jgi:hypothetical protein
MRGGGASAWPAGAGGWMGARARKQGGRKIAGKLRRQESDGSRSESDARKKKGNGVNPDPGRPIYGGSTESARCGSFRRTTRPNGIIPRSSRED